MIKGQACNIVQSLRHDVSTVASLRAVRVEFEPMVR